MRSPGSALETLGDFGGVSLHESAIPPLVDAIAWASIFGLIVGAAMGALVFVILVNRKAEGKSVRGYRVLPLAAGILTAGLVGGGHYLTVGNQPTMLPIAEEAAIERIQSVYGVQVAPQYATQILHLGRGTDTEDHVLVPALDDDGTTVGCLVWLLGGDDHQVTLQCSGATETIFALRNQ